MITSITSSITPHKRFDVAIGGCFFHRNIYVPRKVGYVGLWACMYVFRGRSQEPKTVSKTELGQDCTSHHSVVSGLRIHALGAIDVHRWVMEETGCTGKHAMSQA